MHKKIAITGGIGSGKSAVAQIIRDQGYPVYSCDEIYAELIHSQSYINAVEKAFPTAIKQGKIDKKALADIVFSNEEARIRLNKIAHPLIMQTLLKRMEEATGEIVFAEVPLLFEGNFENLFDHTIVVLRNRELRIRSVCERDVISVKKAEQRVNAQFNYDDVAAEKHFKKINAILIKNEGDLNLLSRRVVDTLKTLS